MNIRRKMTVKYKGGRPSKASKVRKEFTAEEWEKIVDESYYKLLRGQSPSRIKKQMYDAFGLPFSQFSDVKAEIVKRLTENTDAIKEYPTELQLERLHNLLEDAINQQDTQLALKITAEISKLLSLYENRLKVETTEYKLDI